MTDETKSEDKGTFGGGLTLGLFVGAVATVLGIGFTGANMSEKPIPYTTTITASQPLVGHMVAPPTIAAQALDQDDAARMTTQRFSLTNTGSATLAYLNIDCSAFGKDGTRIDERSTAFNEVRPGEEVRPSITYGNTERIVRWSCAVTVQK